MYILASQVRTLYVQGGLCTRVKEWYPSKKWLFSDVGLSSVQMVADRQRHAA